MRAIADGDMPSTLNWSEAARSSAAATAYSFSRRCSSALPITSAANSSRARSRAFCCSSDWALAFR